MSSVPRIRDHSRGAESCFDGYCERTISQISRLKGLCPTPDQEVIHETTKIVVIDLKGSNERCLKAYLYHLVSQSITIQQIVTPSVMVFDGRFLFNELEFVKHFCCLTPDENILRQVELHRLSSEELMLVNLNEHLQVNMALNDNLRLVIIVSNPSDIFPDLQKRLNQLLFSLSISVRIILVVDHLDKELNNFYRQRPTCQTIMIGRTTATETHQAADKADNELTLRVFKCASSTLVLKKIFYKSKTNF